MPEDIIIKLNQIFIGYGKKLLPKPINLEIQRGDFWGIVGPNGGGKTTLLKTIVGLIKPIRGKVEFLNNNENRFKFGYVPQKQQLDHTFPLTALQIVLMGRYGIIGPGRKIGRKDYEKALNTIEQIGLLDVKDKLFRDLSGGQQQRILIARALAADPDILFFDEPTNGMDLASEKSVMNFIKELNNQKITIFLISHQLNIIADYVNKIVYINKDNDMFLTGSKNEIISSESLSSLYQTSVDVIDYQGNYMIRIR